jgi:hypothetical protein
VNLARKLHFNCHAGVKPLQHRGVSIECAPACNGLVQETSISTYAGAIFYLLEHEKTMEQSAGTPENTLRNRASRAIGDLVMAELFLVQATIESAQALGEGLNELKLYWDEQDDAPREELSAFLKRTSEQVVEPYSTRFGYLRKLVSEDIAA